LKVDTFIEGIIV